MKKNSQYKKKRKKKCVKCNYPFKEYTIHHIFTCYNCGALFCKEGNNINYLENGL